jgi:hypothetical protein
MASEQSDDDTFLESSSQHVFPASPKLIAMKRNQELLSKSFLLDDTVTPLVRSMKSASFSTQENGDNERPIYNRRRPSVLDEKALREADTTLIREQRINAISKSYQGILESIGEDPTRQGDIVLSILLFISYDIIYRSTQNT